MIEGRWRARTLFIASFLYAVLFASSYGQIHARSSTSIKEIDTKIQDAMRLHQVPGLALGIIKNDSVWYEGFFGNTLQDTPVNKSSVFKALSITELIVTTAIFKLVDEGQIELKDSIADYLSNVPESWKAISIAHLLAHTSGIHLVLGLIGSESNEGFMKKIKTRPLNFKPGERHEYNQINFFLLGEILATLSQQPFDTYIEKEIFRLTKATTLDCWFTTYLGSMYSNDERAFPLNTMTTTSLERLYDRDMASNGLISKLKPLLDWALRLERNKFFSASTKAQMWTSFDYQKDTFQSAYGWKIFPMNKTLAYGISSPTTSIRVLPQQDITIILLSNGYKHYPVQNEIINMILDTIEPGLVDKNELYFYEMSNRLITSKAYDSRYWIDTIKKNVEVEAQERFFRGLANKAMQLNKKTEAYGFFSANAKAFPNSIDVHKDLSNLFLSERNYAEALKSLQNMVQLDPNNLWAKGMIKRIKK